MHYHCHHTPPVSQSKPRIPFSSPASRSSYFLRSKVQFILAFWIHYFSMYLNTKVLKASPRRRQGVKALREAKASPTPSKKRGRARGRSDWEMKGGARRLPELAGARPPPSSSSTAPAPARSGPQERGCTERGRRTLAGRAATALVPRRSGGQGPRAVGRGLGEGGAPAQGDLLAVRSQSRGRRCC